MVTALDQPSDRVKGLEAGADDFLTKPVNDIALLARVRSLARLKMITDELRARAATSRDIAASDPIAEAVAATGDNGRVLLVDDRSRPTSASPPMLSPHHQVEIEKAPQEALFRLAEGEFDLVIVSLSFTDYDGLRLCSQIRSLERTRQLPVLILAEPDDNARVMRGLDIGVNDYLVRPVDRNELVGAREAPRSAASAMPTGCATLSSMSLEMAVTDPLTSLHNRRYFEAHAAAQLEQAARRGRPLSLLILDIDHFKAINDSWGHDAGDDVLREFAHRVRKNLRGIDLPCRIGGEEFVVVMPDTDMSIATVVAERVRRKIERELFVIHGGERSIGVTVSIGAAAMAATDETLPSLLKRADKALYRAKNDGRNRVVADAA